MDDQERLTRLRKTAARMPEEHEIVFLLRLLDDMTRDRDSYVSVHEQAKHDRDLAWRRMAQAVRLLQGEEVL